MWKILFKIISAPFIGLGAMLVGVAYIVVAICVIFGVFSPIIPIAVAAELDLQGTTSIIYLICMSIVTCGAWGLALMAED